jgi:hypothetical protein
VLWVVNSGPSDECKARIQRKENSMKKLAHPVSVVEVEAEGFLALLGKKVTVFSLNYIYHGTLSGVNDTCIQLEEPSIVYETGSFADKNWKNAQRLPNCLYVQMACIEAFGEVK